MSQNTAEAFKQNNNATQKTRRNRGSFDNAVLLGVGARIFDNEIPNGVRPLDEQDYAPANRNNAPIPY